MKIKRVTEAEEQEENFLGLTLLSKEEYEEYKKNISLIKDWCWLRTPGLYSSSIFSISNNGARNSNFVNNDDLAVRPALILDTVNLNIGDKFKFYNHAWTVISDTYALCNNKFCNMAFRKDWKAEDANVYEKSDIKKYLDNEFEKMMNLDEQPFYDI